MDHIFTLKSVINQFVDRGSTVHAASPDISKAFDKVSHNKIFNLLLAAGQSSIIVEVLINWYNKFSVTTGRNYSSSVRFAVCSGAKHGSISSPALFYLFYKCFHR